jgi:hypothetical protein
VHSPSEVGDVPHRFGGYGAGEHPGSSLGNKPAARHRPRARKQDGALAVCIAKSSSRQGAAIDPVYPKGWHRFSLRSNELQSGRKSSSLGKSKESQANPSGGRNLVSRQRQFFRHERLCNDGFGPFQPVPRACGYRSGTDNFRIARLALQSCRLGGKLQQYAARSFGERNSHRVHRASRRLDLLREG